MLNEQKFIRTVSGSLKEWQQVTFLSTYVSGIVLSILSIISFNPAKNFMEKMFF